MADLVIDIPDQDDNTVDVVETLAIQEHDSSAAAGAGSSTVVTSDGASIRSHKSEIKTEGDADVRDEEKEVEEGEEVVEVEEVEPREEVYRGWISVYPEDNDSSKRRLLLGAEKPEAPVSITSGKKRYHWFELADVDEKGFQFDLVLCVSTKNLKVENVQAILITVNQPTSEGLRESTEVITGQQLINVCQKSVVEVASTDAREGTVIEEAKKGTDPPAETADVIDAAEMINTVEEDKEITTAEEIVETAGATDVIEATESPAGDAQVEVEGEIHSQRAGPEYHQNARGSYADDSNYREHEPMLTSADINKTGDQAHDSYTPLARTICEANVSASGTHIALVAVAGTTKVLQVWHIRHLESSSGGDTESRNPEKDVEPPAADPEEHFPPRLVAWMYLPDAVPSLITPSVNWDGSQDCRDAAKERMALYRIVPSGTGQLPTEAAAGSGLVRNNVEDRFPILKNLYGHGAFHMVATENQDVKDELFITCDSNTIAFKYWLVRFLGQLLYYILVLTAVFLQIYGDNHLEEEMVIEDGETVEKSKLFSDPGPEGLYISIIVIAFIFLYLELVQLMKDTRRYFESVYNMVDLLVFLLPLVGAISQILIIHGVSKAGFNTASISFSVLLIFLHFLFELRVLQIVCHFVSIIIRAIYSIRVFIFVFSGGLLAFSIAVLHLLHDCLDADQCSYFTYGVSNNLLRALSVTYFMMGGNYEPVEGGFTSNSIAFHLMMVTFFCFTVILMMNVLIALINNAIDDGDQSWQLDWLQNRMRYIENAENMTYDIPGFRESHSYFPETIFYSGSSQQVREYEKKTRQMEDEAAPITLNAGGQVQQLPESSETTIASTAAVTAAAVVVAATTTATSADETSENKDTDSKDGGVAKLIENELRKQLDVEREASEKQIGELKEQLEEQQMLVQILSKLER
ncbi:hypothetical protein EC991_004135 [Linnemannia zychae]|nr:hypothetical protein EC991_004135 [Linnemannia zychae]